jgi:dCTP deaminase
MMKIVDSQIRELCQGRVPVGIRSFYSALGIDIPPALLPMVEPYEPSLVNPASIDVRIGESACIEYLDSGWKDVDLSQFTAEKPYWMLPYPHERVLVGTLETFNLPSFIVGIFKLKSSRAREFYQSILAGYADPGWHGSRLTIELLNFNTDPMPLYPGLKMGQMAFDLTFGLPSSDYAVTGRYNGDMGAARSKG